MDITYSATEEQKNLVDAFLRSLYIDDKKCKISEPNEVIRWLHIVRIQFPDNSTMINSQYYKDISDFAKTVNHNDKMKIKIRAWADKFETNSETNNEIYHQQLSDRRIEAFKTLLITKYGVNPKKFTQDESYGSSHPLDSSDTEENRQINRFLSAEIY